MANHDCTQESELREIKETLNRQVGNVKAILWSIGIFTFLTGFTMVQATGAGDKASAAEKRIDAVTERVSVQDERLKWIQEAVKRIEKKLDHKER